MSVTLLLLPLLAACCGSAWADPTPTAPAASSTSAAASASGPAATVTAEPGLVKILHREAAVFPREARDQQISAGGCVVRVYFDEWGMPTGAFPLECDEVWVASATTAALKYRFAPYLVDGVPRRARYDMAFVYSVSPPVPAPSEPAAPPIPAPPGR